MSIPVLMAIGMIITVYYGDKAKRLSISIARRECDKRFKHYCKYVL